MGFKVTGTLKVLAVAKTKEDLAGFRVAAKKSGFDLTASVLAEEPSDKVLYFRTKMLGYDLPNANGDAIPRIYASAFGPSFIGKVLDLDHVTDGTQDIGKILATYHVEVPLIVGEGEERIIGKTSLGLSEDSDTHELQVEGICMIDRTTPLGDIVAKKLLSGELTAVSQEANTDYAECSVCQHKINGPADSICAHMGSSSLMVEAYAVEGKKHKVLAYKIHHNPVGTGLAVVGQPAYGKAQISDIVAKVKAGEVGAESAIDDLTMQELVFGGSPMLLKAKKQIEKIQIAASKDKTVTEALTKLNGVETLAIMAALAPQAEEKEVEAPLKSGKCLICEEKVGPTQEDMEEHYKEKHPATKEANEKAGGEWVKASASVKELLSLCKPFSDINLTLQSVLNASKKSGLSLSGSVVQGSADSVMAAASVAAVAGLSYKDTVDAFWRLAAAIDPAVQAVIEAKDKATTPEGKEALSAAVAALSPEAKAISPACLVPWQHLQGKEGSDGCIEASLSASLLRKFLVKASPESFTPEYKEALSALVAETPSFDKVPVLASLEKEMTGYGIRAYGSTNSFAPLLLKAGFVEASKTFSEEKTEDKARVLLSYLLPKTFKLEAGQKVNYDGKVWDLEVIPGDTVEYFLVHEDSPDVELVAVAGADEDTVDIIDNQSGDKVGEGTLVHGQLKEETMKFNIPVGAGYTLEIQANGAVSRKSKVKATGIQASLRKLVITSKHIDDMSVEELKLLKNSWSDAENQLKKDNPDPETMNLLKDETSRIDEAIAMKAAKVKAYSKEDIAKFREEYELAPEDYTDAEVIEEMKISEEAKQAEPVEVINAKTPPHVSEKLIHKLKKEYPGEKDKAYATAWSIENKMKKGKKKGGK